MKKRVKEVSGQVLMRMTEKIANNKSVMLWGEVELSEALKEMLKKKKNQ